MSKQVDASFEILHLVSILSLRFSNVFIKCDLDVEQVYTLVYINSYGKLYPQKDNNEIKLVQRDQIGKILEDIFHCDKNRRTELIKDLYHKDLVDDFYLTKSEKDAIFGEGKTRVLSLTENGSKKTDEFTNELKNLFYELTDTNHNLLFLPQTSRKGKIAMMLVGFLKIFRK